MIPWQEPDTSTPGPILCSVPTAPGCLTAHLFPKLEQESPAALWLCKEKLVSGWPSTWCQQDQGSAGATGEGLGIELPSPLGRASQAAALPLSCNGPCV